MVFFLKKKIFNIFLNAHVNHKIEINIKYKKINMDQQKIL